MIPMDLTWLQTQLDTRFGGGLAVGANTPGSVACVLEFAHVVAGDPWEDTPDLWPDLRPLNDGPWSSPMMRAAHLLPVLVAVWDWASWPVARQHAWAERVALAMVQDIIAELPHLPEVIRAQCREATTLELAKTAAEAARAAVATETAVAAAWGAVAATEAAETAVAASEAARAAAEAAMTVVAAAWAAVVAAWAARVALWAARAAAMAAEAVAEAAEADSVLSRTCTIWISAAMDD